MGRRIRLDKSVIGGARLSASLVETIDELPNGQYDILIEKRGYVRTLSQNRLFWMWMTELEYWSGTPRKKWHDYFVSLFIPPYRNGTSDLSTEAMKHFMNQVHAEALVEWGVELPLPDDSDMFYDFVDEYKFK